MYWHCSGCHSLWLDVSIWLLRVLWPRGFLHGKIYTAFYMRKIYWKHFHDVNGSCVCVAIKMLWTHRLATVSAICGDIIWARWRWDRFWLQRCSLCARYWRIFRWESMDAGMLYSIYQFSLFLFAVHYKAHGESFHQMHILLLSVLFELSAEFPAIHFTQCVYRDWYGNRRRTHTTWRLIQIYMTSICSYLWLFLLPCRSEGFQFAFE